jgi:hypothetical protein
MVVVVSVGQGPDVVPWQSQRMQRGKAGVVAERQAAKNADMSEAIGFIGLRKW